MARQKINTCVSCNRLFKGRLDARTCSGACRKRIQRTRLAAEREALALKKTVEDIVAAVEDRVIPFATEEGFVGESALPATSLPAQSVSSRPIEPTSVTPVQTASNPVVNLPQANIQETTPPKSPVIEQIVMPPQQQIPTPAAITSNSQPATEETLEYPPHSFLPATPGTTFQPTVSSPAPDITSGSRVEPNLAVSQPRYNSSSDLPQGPDSSFYQASAQPGISPSNLLSSENQSRSQGARFGIPVWARMAIVSTLLVSTVAIGTYLLGNQSAQNKLNNQASTSTTVAGQDALPSGSNVESLHFNKALTIDQGASLTTTGTATFKNLTNSSDAFNVQKADGTKLITVNTDTGVVTIAGLQGSGTDLTNLNASKLTTGTVSDARLSTNVALLNGTGPQTFTGDNRFGGAASVQGATTLNNTLTVNGSSAFLSSLLLKNASDSTTAFQIQNSAGTSNLFVADTTNTRVAIGQSAAAYTLDVNGNVNVTAGNTFKIAGTDICSASGCTSASNSNYYIQNSTVVQSANFAIQSSAASSVAAVIKGAVSQTADLLQIKDANNNSLLTVGPSGSTLIQTPTNSTTAFQVLNNNGTSHLIVADTLNARVAIAQPTANYALDVGGDINSTTGIRVGGNLVCDTVSCTPAPGSGSYIQNTTSLQTGNFAIQSDLNSHIVAKFRGASGQSADLIQAISGDGGSTVLSVGATGNTVFRTASGFDSATAFQVQNAAASPVFGVDTVSGRVGIGTNAPNTSLQITNFSDAKIRLQGSAYDTLVFNNGATEEAYLNYDIAGTTVNLWTNNRNLSILPTGTGKVSIAGTPANSVLTVGTNTTAATGGIYFGTDTNLYRSAASTLFTDGGLTVNGTLQTKSDLTVRQGNSTQQLVIGAVGPSGQSGLWLQNGEAGSNLYRSAAGALKTDGALTAVGNIQAARFEATSSSSDMFLVQSADSGSRLLLSARVSGGAANMFSARVNGQLLWGDGTAAQDTNLYRSGSNALTTDGALTVAGRITGSSDLILSGNPAGGKFLQLTGSNSTMGGGAGGGINIAYSAAAGGVGTIDRPILIADSIASSVSVPNRYAIYESNITVGSGGSLTNNYGLYMENQTAGTNNYGIYLQGASTATVQLASDAGTAASGISFGSAADTNLYRSAADTLKTSDSFIVGTNFTANGTVLVQNASNSTTSFQVQNAAGSPILNVDTTNKRVGVGLAAPLAPLHVLNGTAGATFTPVTDETIVLQRNQNTNDNAVLTLISGSVGETIIRLTSAGNTESGKIGYNNNTRTLYFFTNGSQKLSLDTNGTIALTGGQTKDITTASAGTSAALVFAPGDSTTNSGTGSSLTLRGSNQTGTTSVGGNLVLQGGTGTSTNGQVQLGTANTSAISLGASGILTTNNGSLTVTQNLTANGTVLAKNATDSSTAFQIQNSNGTAVLAADTTNQQINVTNLQSTGSISLQNSQGASIQLRTVSSSSTGLTVSGNELTDKTRSTSTQGDGRQAPDSSTGVWEGTTNLITNGGLETDLTNWSGQSNVTLARTTAISKFGTASAQASTTNGGAQNAVLLTSTKPGSNGTMIWSFWAKTSSGTGSINVGALSDNVSSLTALDGLSINTAWQRYRFSFTFTNAASPNINPYIALATTGINYYFDGMQIEQKAYATPYVETNGGTASRSAAAVQAPVAVTNATQGWVAVRFRAEWSADPGSTGYELFGWADNNTHYYSLFYGTGNGNNLNFVRANGSGGANADKVQQSFTPTVGGLVTAVARWDSGNVYLSVNGGAFASVAGAHIPTLAASTFYIGGGSATNIGQADGETLWFASGTGTLTNSDATTLNAYGNSDPTIAGLTSLNSGAATPSFAWSGVDAKYSGTNASYVSQSGISLDDTTLYRSSANTLASNNNFLLQSSTNSATAFVVQDANSSSYLTIDTSGSNIYLGAYTPATIQIGIASGNASAQTINIGNNSTASSSTTINIGSTIGTSPLTLQGGSTGTKIKSTSTTAFVIQKADATGTIFTADTSTGAITVAGTLTASNGLTISSGSLVTSSTGIYVSALPGSPVDGQEVYYKADATNGVIWHLRYNAGSASTYKWEYLGGAPLSSYVATSEGTTSTTYAALPTAGPSITVPNEGDYWIEISARLSRNGSGVNEAGYMSYDIGGTGAADVDAIGANFTLGSTGVTTTDSRSKLKTAIAASTAITGKYRVTGGNGGFDERTMRITPVRIK